MKSDIEKINIKKENFFSRFSLNLSDERKKKIALSEVNNVKLKKLYWLELSLSAIIATLGLLNNSVAVIIGAMLIAPLFTPIQTLSFGIINSQHKMTIKSLRNIIISIILAISLSWLIAVLVPLNYETSEMISRINPNILDLFIAVFSAVIAFLSILYKKELSIGIAGVAMAASLLPPLSVVGIEIHLMNYAAAWGSFLLFLTNIIAIIFTGIWLFFFFGFGTYQDDDKKIFRRNIFILIFIIIIISIPLISSLMKINKKIEQKGLMENSIMEVFKKDNINNVKIFKIDRDNYTGKNEKIFLSLKIPEGVSFYKNTQEKIRKNISDILNKNIDLEIEILRTAKISAPSKIPLLKNKINEILNTEFDNIKIIDTRVFKKEDGKFSSKIIFSLNNNDSDSEIKFTKKIKDNLENKIISEIKEKDFEFNWIYLESGGLRKKEVVKKITDDDILKNKIKTELEKKFSNIEFKISKIVFNEKNDSVVNVSQGVNDDGENNILEVKEAYMVIDIFKNNDIDIDKENILVLVKEIIKNYDLNLEFRIFDFKVEKINSLDINNSADNSI